MIFRTTEHYLYDNINNCNKSFNTNELDICFICLENENENKNKLIKLNNHYLFTKVCVCDGWVHNNCLKCWYDNIKTCPICREQLIQQTNFSEKKLNKNLIGLTYFIAKSTYYLVECYWFFEILIFIVFVL